MAYWIAAGVVVVLVVGLAALGNRRRRDNGDGVPLQTDSRRQGGDERLLRQRSRGRF
jgi:hypothetical protein